MNSFLKLKKNTNSTRYKAQNVILFKLSYLLKTGVHLGTTLQEHYPPMPYIIGFRHNILIIDLTRTIFLLKRSLYFLVYLIRARSRACIASYTYNTFIKNYTIYNKKLNNFLSIKSTRPFNCKPFFNKEMISNLKKNKNYIIIIKLIRIKNLKLYLLKKKIKSFEKNKILFFLISLLIFSLVKTKNLIFIKVSLLVLYQVLILCGFTLIFFIYYNHNIFFIKNKEDIKVLFIILLHLIILCFIPVIFLYLYNIIFFIYLKILFENNFKILFSNNLSTLIAHKYSFIVLYVFGFIILYFYSDCLGLDNLKIFIDNVFLKIIITGFRLFPAGSAAASLSSKSLAAVVKGSNGTVLGIGLGAIGTGGVVIHLRSESLIRLENETAKRASLLAEAKETNRHLETMAALPVKVALKENQISIAGRVVFSQKKTSSIIPLDDL